MSEGSSSWSQMLPQKHIKSTSLPTKMGHTHWPWLSLVINMICVLSPDSTLSPLLQTAQCLGSCSSSRWEKLSGERLGVGLGASSCGHTVHLQKLSCVLWQEQLCHGGPEGASLCFKSPCLTYIHAHTSCLLTSPASVFWWKDQRYTQNKRKSEQRKKALTHTHSILIGE